MKNEQTTILSNFWKSNLNISSLSYEQKGIFYELLFHSLLQQKKGYLLKNSLFISELLNISIEKLESMQDSFNWIPIKKIKSEFYYDFSFIFPPKKTKKTISQKDGFDLSIILDSNENNTILFSDENEKINNEINKSIWNIGVSLLVSNDKIKEDKARAFLAKQIKQFGSKKVAETINTINKNNNKPLHIQSFLIKLLKNSIVKKNINIL